MTRGLVFLALLVTVLFSGTVLVMRARPYDDRALVELFPESCTIACFVDIRPGTTTDQEAMSILKDNPWVNRTTIQFINLPPSSSKFDLVARIQWDWDARRPAFLRMNDKAPDANIIIRNHVIESIAFDSTIPAAAIYRRFGSPTEMIFAPVHNNDPWLIQWAYPGTDTQFNMQMQVRPCPYMADTWLQPIYIFITARRVTTFTDTEASLNLSALLNARVQTMCRAS